MAYGNSEFDVLPVTVIILFVMLSLFSVIGCVGNLVTIYIFSKKRARNSFTLLILVLAATDLFASVVVIPFTIATESLRYALVYDAICKFYMFSTVFIVPQVLFLLTVVAFDQYCCNCHQSSRVLTCKRAAITIVILTIVSIGFGILSSLQFGVHVYGVYENQAPLFNMTTTFYSNTGRADTTESIVVESPRSGYTTEYIGICISSDVIFSNAFKIAFQKVYFGLFGLLVVAMFVLYVTLFVTLSVRRGRANGTEMYLPSGIEKTRETTQMTVVRTETMAEGTEIKAGETLVTAKGTQSPKTAGILTDGDNTSKIQSEIRETKPSKQTAVMMLVISVITFLAFLPSMIMASAVLEFQIIIFYLYFLSYVGKPIVYLLVNPEFRGDVRNIITGCR